MMIDRIISGGRSGVDQATLRAARSAGIPTGGTAPRLYLAEVEQESLGGTTRWWKPEQPGRPAHADHEERARPS
jgi:hypothetical protein